MNRAPDWLRLLGVALLTLLALAVVFFILAGLVASAIKHPGVPSLFILIWLICGPLFGRKERRR